jgi:Translation initiation factor IF-2, N-terminal region
MTEMSKRVYEIAKDLDLDTKEVIGQLNDAGIEVKSHHFAVVEDPIYEKVFGENPDDTAPNGRLKVQDLTEGLRSVIWSLWESSLPFRVLVYILVAILVFMLSVGIGAVASLLMQAI